MPVTSGSEWLALLVYAVTGLLVSAVIASLLNARRRAERAAARTERLHALNLALAPALAPEDASEIIIRHAMQALNARSGAIVYGAADGAEPSVVRSPGHPGHPAEPGGPLAEALHAGAPVFVESAAAWAAAYPSAASRGVTAGSVAAVPFMTEGRPSGGLELEFDHDRRLAPDDRNFIVTLAGQGAQALERARLYQAERLARRRAEAEHDQMEFLAPVVDDLGPSHFAHR